MKYIYLFLTSQLLTSVAFGQSYIIPGKIVLNNGDTVNGFIHDKQSDRNPSIINFQKERNGAIEEFQIGDIISFSTSRGALYERHVIKYDDSKEALTTLSTSREPEHYATEIALLQILVNGGIKLSSYVDGTSRRHYFIHEKGDDPRELLNRSYIFNVSGQPAARIYEPWRQQLFMMAQQCPSLSSKIKNSTKYSDSSLSSAFRELNDCLGFKVIEIKENNELAKRKTDFGFVLHTFVTHIFFETDRDHGESAFAQPNLGFGGFVEFFSRKRPDRLSIYNEVKLKQINQEGTSTVIYTPGFEIQSIKLVNCIRFHYPMRKSSVFGSFGIANGFRSAKVNYSNKSGGNILYVLNTEKKGFENGIILGFGIKRKVGIIDLSAIVNLDHELLVVLSRYPTFRTTSLGLTLQASF